MNAYRIDAIRSENGWIAQCKAFNVTIDAVELEHAIDAVKSECENLALAILQDGNALPADEPIQEFEFDGITVYFQTSVQDAHEANNQTPVRRNISLPAWLDKMIRKANIDASKLFQDAAIAKLREMRLSRQGIPKISSVHELRDACQPGVLDDFFAQKLNEIMRAAAKDSDTNRGGK